jgi:hypothetical protein
MTGGGREIEFVPSAVLVVFWLAMMTQQVRTEREELLGNGPCTYGGRHENNNEGGMVPTGPVAIY